MIIIVIVLTWYSVRCTCVIDIQSRHPLKIIPPLLYCYGVDRVNSIVKSIIVVVVANNAIGAQQQMVESKGIGTSCQQERDTGVS